MQLYKLIGWNSCCAQWMEDLMIKKLITLFKLGRKVAKSDILNITSNIQEPPLTIKIFFKVLSFSFSQKKEIDITKNEGERLSHSYNIYGHKMLRDVGHRA